MSFVCTFGFIWFEGFDLVRMARHFGYKTSAIDGTVYGGADVYFSAITPVSYTHLDVYKRQPTPCASYRAIAKW